MPDEDVPVSDQGRTQLALNALGCEDVTIPLSVIRKLYPHCRNAWFDITVPLVRRDYDWIVVDIESGDQRMDSPFSNYIRFPSSVNQDTFP